jgi:RNA polymerase sigma-70 factor (ECF subfamily)
LCQSYWYPLYAYARRRGCSPEDAQDMTQGFFARLLEGNWLADADRRRGRFRSFLLAMMKHFMANEWDKAHALKRGGCQPPVSLDALSAETRYRREPADTDTADKLFDRQWAITLLDQVLACLRSEFTADGRAPLFDALKGATVNCCGRRLPRPSARPRKWTRKSAASLPR